MKTGSTILTSAALAALTFAVASCDKGGDNGGNGGNGVGATAGQYIDATSKTAWHYYSFAEGRVVGSAEESEADNAAWAARTDWDVAFRRLNVRTNSGASSSKGAKGGVYTLDAAGADRFGNITATTGFDAVTALPAATEFVADRAFTLPTHGGGTETVVRSTAVAVQLRSDANGPVMPPDYRPAPVYIFRTADGLGHYKVQFTQYFSDDKVSGHVKFNVARIGR